jgi:hypothetical protein
MSFPTDWPEECPPDDAVDALGIVYRITKNNPPTAADMLSHHETGRIPTGPPCIRCGLSIFRTQEDALHQQSLMPRLGKVIAEGNLRPEHGKMKLTQGRQPTHTTWWVYVTVTDRAAIFTVVQVLP